MKKYFGLVLALGLIFTSNAFAQTRYATRSEVSAPDRVNRWDFGMGIANSANDEADDAAFVYGQISYGVTPYIGLGVEAGWQEADLDSNGNGQVGVVPVMFDIILRLPTVHEALVPYGILGLGGTGVYVETNNLDDVDDIAFTWKLGAGLDYFVNSAWIVNLEFAYWSAGVDLPTTAITDDFDWWTFGISLKYVF